MVSFDMKAMDYNFNYIMNMRKNGDATSYEFCTITNTIDDKVSGRKTWGLFETTILRLPIFRSISLRVLDGEGQTAALVSTLRCRIDIRPQNVLQRLRQACTHVIRHWSTFCSCRVRLICHLSKHSVSCRCERANEKKRERDSSLIQRIAFYFREVWRRTLFGRASSYRHCWKIS